MIRISVNVNENRKSLSLKAKGHANAAGKGHDLICSAASILTITFAQLAGDYDKASLLEKCSVSLLEGNASISLKAKNEETFTVLLASLLTVVRGYELLAANFPDNICVLHAQKL